MRWLRLTLGVLLGVVLLVAGWAWQRIGRIDVEKVTDDVYMLTGVGGNVAVLVTDEGVVVVDTMTFVRQGAAILARIRSLTDQPVVAVLNTHYHLDHTHGNPAFAPGSKVVATTNTLRHLRERDAAFWADAPARDLLPNDTFEDTRELRLGGKTIRAVHPGRGHTDGDLVVQFVEDRVLAAGDLLFNGHFPNIDLEAGGSIEAWPTTIERALQLDFERLIPGHGPVTDRDGFRVFQGFMANLWAQTRRVAASGGSLDDALSRVDIEKFGLRRLWFAPQLNREFVIRRAYEEASRPRPAAH
jgi:glyoxylase-like metal-dependent hydrolase (beta-lactamase superfamily II)